MEFTDQERAQLRAMLSNELTESVVYSRLAEMQKDEHNAEILKRIAADELSHAKIIQGLLGEEGVCDSRKAGRLVFIAKVFGLSFGLKRMENGEAMAEKKYVELQQRIPALAKLAEDEQRHEQELIDLLHDGHLESIGAVVLGLNDALVELTGALAGFSFAMPSQRMVAITGLITGLSASMSMAASGYLQARAENDPKKPPLKSALYTGCSYVLTVILLVLPFFLLSSRGLALGSMLGAAALIIAAFNYYISVACNESFWKRFGEMAALSGGVAVISLLIGHGLQRFLGN